MKGVNFIAIDFETATSARDTACSIGIVVVKDGKIENKLYFLINPKCEFNKYTTLIHGIREEDVENEPEFHEIWGKIKHLFEDSLVVAHNIEFDMNVLKEMLDRYGLDHPNSNYLCSVKLSQKYITEVENHKLNTLAEHYGIKFHHHHALEDAVVCAIVMLDIVDRLELEGIDELVLMAKKEEELLKEKKAKSKKRWRKKMRDDSWETGEVIDSEGERDKEQNE